MGFRKAFRRHKSTKRSKSSPSKITPEDHDSDDCFISCRSQSLVTGSFNAWGVLSVTSSIGGGLILPSGGSAASSLTSSDHEETGAADGASKLERKPSRVFIRTADLPHMKEAVLQSRRSSFSDLDEEDLVDHVHRPSSTPPLPSLENDPNESWVALDDGNGKKAPLAEAAMDALVKTGLDASMDRGMWTANGATNKILKSGVWDDTAFASVDERSAVSAPHARGAKGENDVLVWSGSWSHKYYGHELPAIRCEAIVNMSPGRLMDLLVDSTRVKEYNKMSIGRDDIMVLHKDDKWVTKVCVARTKPPMLGKTLVLKNLLHMEHLPGGGERAGYVIASRAVAHADDVEAAEDPKVIHSEMLMGLNVIRAVEGEPDRCVLINLNHLRSPMIPMMMAKRLGLSAAVNFINDIRALC